jgi:predicted transcriptional regulator of viral defense system
MSRLISLSSQRLESLPATFTTATARAAHLAPRELYRMRDDGVLLELSRGVFRKADAPATAHLDLLAVTLRAPHAVVCGQSALALHELIDDIPARVHIAVPRGTHPPHIDYPPTAVSRFDAATFTEGLEDFEAAPGEFIRVYGAARSVVDAMRLRPQYADLALPALRAYLRRRDANPGELLRLARLLGVEGPVRTATEAILA